MCSIWPGRMLRLFCLHRRSRNERKILKSSEFFVIFSCILHKVNGQEKRGRVHTRLAVYVVQGSLGGGGEWRAGVGRGGGGGSLECSEETEDMAQEWREGKT